MWHLTVFRPQETDLDHLGWWVQDLPRWYLDVGTSIPITKLAFAELRATVNHVHHSLE